MSSILIKSKTEENDSLFFHLAKVMKLPVRILNEDDEQDLLLIQSIEDGMKSGKASKEKVNKFLTKYGIRIH